MTTYNILILDKMIQHHYESTEVIRPAQEEVENALNSIKWDIWTLEERNAEMLYLFKILLSEMDNVDKMCEIAGKHPFTGMRGAIELGITKGEGR